ncbi:MAG: hypothetical protein L7T62_05695 [Flavobacteriaceae bacterium]|nr:hypothetical protein [Flavobacteriaceae bacterium]
MKPEKNRLLDGFVDLVAKFEIALDSQGLIQLKNNYCDAKKCLLCAIEVHLINHPIDA